MDGRSSPGVSGGIHPALARWGQALAALVLACLAGAACAQAVEIKRAEARITVAGEQVRSGPVDLPYHLERDVHSRPATAVFEMAFAAPHAASGPYGLYFARIGNNAEVYLNDILLVAFGDLDRPNDADYSKAPRYVSIPARLLQPSNRLRVVLRADGGRRGGLSSIVAGPDHEVRPFYDRAYFWRMTASLAVVVLSVLVGTVALMLWATQVESSVSSWRRDSIYLSAAVAEWCWALRVGDIAIENPPLPWPAWGVVVTAAFAGWICCIALFCHHAAGWHRHRSMPAMRVFLWALFGASVLASTLSFTLHQPLFLTAWLGFANVFFAGYAVVYLVAAVRRPNPARLLVGIVGALNVAVGVRDWIAIRISGDYSESTWIRYSSILFGMALGYIVVTRFQAASAQARDLAAHLAERVAQREQALAESYTQLERLAREQERAAERTRVLRDMHDGVGSHLSAAIRQLQSGRAEAGQVLQTVRDALEQLKLSIDAMNLPAGDVTGLLAGLRYRLQPRFAACDLALEWDVEDLPPLPRLDSAAMRQLQFIVFEALSNVLQHAEARTLRVEATPQPDGVRLRIVDDGRGFDASPPWRPGLRSMHDRAAALGARLRLESRPGRTVVELVIPT